MSAYCWLARNYQKDDRIFLIGFSRGAYTVRSLGGMVSKCGLLDLSGLSDNDLWKRVDSAYKKGYRKSANKKDWAKNWAFHKSNAAGSIVDIHFIGVWDTVGALGVPNDLAILNIFDDRDKYLFHDTKLSAKIINARHAVALDEMRSSFTPTLWDEKKQKTDLKQVWFTGVHCDVGGGYAENGLSDTALKWMIDESASKGLEFQEGLLKQIKPDYQDVLHDSYSGVFSLLLAQPRSIPNLVKSKSIDSSALNRSKEPPIFQAPYRETSTMKKGQGQSLSIYAIQRWNVTGIYLEKGIKYNFKAEGQWLDSSIKCGPAGTDDGDFQVGELVHIVSSLLGKAEKLWGALTKNKDADFKGTKREEDFPWFSLIGVIGNGGNPGKDGTPKKHETFLIGEGCDHTPKESGYLYCFANDAWNFYENNKGSVSLIVTKV